jgi:hypothetical protein
VLAMNNIQKTDDSLTAYQKLLDIEFTSRWEEIAKTKASEKAKKQDQLFNFENAQGNLL